MFEKYTEKARRTIFFGRYEVGKLGGTSLGPEHLLLGLLREDTCLIPRLLDEREESVKMTIRRRIEEHGCVGKETPVDMEIPLNREAKEVLRYAAEESEGMSHRHIGTEHFLLGLLRVEGSFAAEVLRDEGVEYDRVRQVLKEMYGE